MEWQLNDLRKKQYNDLLHSAQEVESSIGSTNYQLFKLLKMRESVDISVKTWWEEVIKEMALDPNKDYMVDREGTINDISRKQEQAPIESKEGTNSAELV